MVKSLEMRTKDIGLLLGGVAGATLGYFVAKDNSNLIVPKIIEYFSVSALAGYSLTVAVETSLSISKKINDYLFV